MAFDPKPNMWLENWSEDGINVTVPIASFAELSAAEADGDTGDIRKVVFALCEKLWKEWVERPEADRPKQLAIAKSTTSNATTGMVTHTYTFTFKNEITGQDVSAEPA